MTAIVDFEDALHRAQKALQCPICLETMAIPILTKCGHRFCSRCLDELLKRKKQGGGAAACPLCKQPVSKRSLAKQAKFESIVKVVEKLADAFQEDLVNPINADWCGADTLERDLSQGYGGSLLGTCLGQLPAAQQQQPTPVECSSLPVEAARCGTAGSISSNSSSKVHRLVVASGSGELEKTNDCRSYSEIGVVAADAVGESTVAVGNVIPARHVALPPSSLMSEGISCGVTVSVAAATIGSVTDIPLAVQTECDVSYAARTTVTDEQIAVPVTGELTVAFTDLTADGGNKWPIEQADAVSVPQPAVPLRMVSSSSDSVVVVPDDEAVCLSYHGNCDEADDSAGPSHDAEPSVMVVDGESATSSDRQLIVAPCCFAATKATPAAEQLPAELQSKVSDRNCVPAAGAGSSALVIVAAPSPSADRLASPFAQPYINQPSDCQQQSGKKIDASSDDTALESQPAATAMVCEDSCPEDMEMSDDVAFEEALISSNQALGMVIPVAAHPAAAAPLVMTGCSLSLQDADEAQRLARLHSGRYQTTFTSAVTHVLVRTLDEDEGRESDELPAKVYLGIAAGCHIVTVSWIYDSLQRGALLPEVSYRVRSAIFHECCVRHSASSVPQSPVITPSCRAPSLLATWEVCCGSPCRRFSPDELHDLIMLCGARKVRHPSSFSYRPGSSRVILLEMEHARKDNSEIYARFGQIYASPVADYNWLLTCIVNGRPFIPEKGCTMGCSLPGCTELWNQANVPALFTGS